MLVLYWAFEDAFTVSRGHFVHRYSMLCHLNVPSLSIKRYFVSLSVQCVNVYLVIDGHWFVRFSVLFTQLHRYTVTQPQTDACKCSRSRSPSRWMLQVVSLWESLFCNYIQKSGYLCSTMEESIRRKKKRKKQKAWPRMNVEWTHAYYVYIHTITQSQATSTHGQQQAMPILLSLAQAPNCILHFCTAKGSGSRID